VLHLSKASNSRNLLGWSATEEPVRQAVWMVERFGQLDQLASKRTGILICIKLPSLDGGRLPSWSMWSGSTMFRYSRCGLLRSPNLSGFFGVKCRSGAGLNVSGPIDFRLGMGGKGI